VFRWVNLKKGGHFEDRLRQVDNEKMDFERQNEVAFTELIRFRI